MVGRMQVRSAVIPAAGMGTRFLPASKAVPKELLPIGDTPTLQLVIDEALGAGIDHIVVVSSRSKPAVEAYFEPSPEIVATLEASGKTALAERVRSIGCGLDGDDRLPGRAAGPRSRRRLRPRGHRRRAVRRAAPRRADGRLVAARPHERRVRRDRAAASWRSRRCPHEEVGRYGVIAPTGPVDADGVVPIGDMVEKPPVDEAPSDLIIIGRYVLTPDVFDEIAAGRSARSARSSSPTPCGPRRQRSPFHGVVSRIDRFDTGTPLGFLTAAIELGLRDPANGAELRTFLDDLARPDAD